MNWTRLLASLARKGTFSSLAFLDLTYKRGTA